MYLKSENIRIESLFGAEPFELHIKIRVAPFSIGVEKDFISIFLSESEMKELSDYLQSKLKDK